MKQELQNKVNELKLTLGSLELNAKTVKDDLKEATKKLEDASKPIITKDILEQIQYVIDESIRESSLSNVDSYDVDFEIDYNNSLALGSIEFNDADQLSEEIADGIENIFNIIEN
jgi:hypothetical protein|tara:strand:- start:230 stop:574 length:345 start_codon:yes stop_codon:yes gene_type:complete